MLERFQNCVRIPLAFMLTHCRLWLRLICPKEIHEAFLHFVRFHCRATDFLWGTRLDFDVQQRWPMTAAKRFQTGSNVFHAIR